MNASSKGTVFRKLHESSELFIMPNPWDVGTTRIFSQCGFKALATSSGGLAYSLGKKDGLGVSREEALQHSADMVAATSLPVSADLENGYGDTPDEIAKIITDVSKTGVAGCSIEDYTGNSDFPIYDETLAIERIQAAHEARLSLTEDFVLTARCEKFVWGQTDIDAVIERLKAFERAGADVLFAPGVQDIEDIKLLVYELTKPVNILMSTPKLPYGISELKEIGVKRVSIGSAIAQLIYGTAIEAITEISEHSTFNFLDSVIHYEKLENWFN